MVSSWEDPSQYQPYNPVLLVFCQLICSLKASVTWIIFNGEWLNCLMSFSFPVASRMIAPRRSSPCTSCLMHSRRAQWNHLPSDCLTPQLPAQGRSLWAVQSLSGEWVTLRAHTQELLPLSASVLPSYLFKNRSPSVYTYDREQRAKRHKFHDGIRTWISPSHSN